MQNNNQKTARAKRHDLRKLQLQKIYDYVKVHPKVTYKDIQNLLKMSLTTAKVYFKQAQSDFPFEAIMIKNGWEDAIFEIKHYEVSK